MPGDELCQGLERAGSIKENIISFFFILMLKTRTQTDRDKKLFQTGTVLLCHYVLHREDARDTSKGSMKKRLLEKGWVPASSIGVCCSFPLLKASCETVPLCLISPVGWVWVLPRTDTLIKEQPGYWQREKQLTLLGAGCTGPSSGFKWSSWVSLQKMTAK